MGADLTIEKTRRYFRDSYNSWNSWWPIGLSYWSISEEFQKKGWVVDGVLKLEGVKEIARLVKATKFDEQRVETRYRDDCKKFEWEVTNNKLHEYIEQMRTHDKEMREFWGEAVKEKSAVEWSV